MAEKSEVAVLDVLFKNEACNREMLKTSTRLLGTTSVVQSHLVEIYLHMKGRGVAKQHVMDFDSPTGRLGHLEPITEDWHS